jgi:methionine sulfoxide reductase heme-binding subunit
MTDSILWYTTRAAGIVSLILLTAVVCLGILQVVRWGSPGWPRFLSAALHGNIALLSIVFLVVHIVVAVIDPFTSLGWASALVPFSSGYRQVWLGLGGVSMYLVGALIATSLLRSRLGLRTWRIVHWLAYGAWPLAVLHGLGTGSDTGAPWLWAVDGVCIAAVVAALGWRITATRSARRELEAALPLRTVRR